MYILHLTMKLLVKEKLRIILVVLIFWCVLMFISDDWKYLSQIFVSKISSGLVQNIIFLKTHKTGSTTVTNVMQRYSKLNGLKPALPFCDHRFCYPSKFDDTFLFKHSNKDKYNIIFNHAVFNKENMIKIMASNNTKIVTIIREPYSQLESTANYFNFRKFYSLRKDLPLLEALFKMSDEDLKRFLHSSDPTMGEGAFYLTKNPNSFDMGFDVWNDSSEYIDIVIRRIERDFNLVMITEYMEESLVLLKNELMWDLKDVIFCVHNARTTKVQSPENIEKVRHRVFQWNKLDYSIYNHFNETFWLKVKSLSPQFESEVRKLKQWNRYLHNHCRFNKSSKFSIFLINDYYKRCKGNFCIDFKTDEVAFTDWFKSMRSNDNIYR
ncbi:galactose-3-O-sulfotransferase 3-like isoform X2 [Hydra vulgaris]|uniref:Galactose-3-O-sulfotransferase 3-like isoform X2 n=1 Tax=Hydra vulgaris TaxID=6087 RepID=A0ABM4C1Z1_HYDVU